MLLARRARGDLHAGGREVRRVGQRQLGLAATEELMEASPESALESLERLAELLARLDKQRERDKPGPMLRLNP